MIYQYHLCNMMGVHRNFGTLSYTGLCTEILAQSIRYAGPVDNNMDFCSLGFGMQSMKQLKVVKWVKVVQASIQGYGNVIGHVYGGGHLTGFHI